VGISDSSIGWALMTFGYFSMQSFAVMRSTALTCAACVDPSLALTSKKNTCISVMPASVRPMREGSYPVRMDLRQPHHRSGVPVVVVRDHVVAVAAGKVFSGDCR